MQQVLTLVGTSLITNFLDDQKEKATLISKQVERYKLFPASQYDVNKRDIDQIKKRLQEFVEREPEASAEISSLRRIHEEQKDKLIVHLLASDTVNSRICAEVIRDYCQFENTEIAFNERQHIISGLQVTNREQFNKDGLQSLFNVIEQITGGYYGYTLCNITGGYKATIPLMTIFAQVNRMPLYYLFEDSSALLKIPSLPITVDWELFERYANIFVEAEQHDWAIDDWRKTEANIMPEHRETFASFVEHDGAFALVTMAGQMLWRKFKSRRRILHWNQEVKARYESDSNAKHHLLKLFSDHRGIERKAGHLVLDAGGTLPRIFHLWQHGELYVYKYFPTHNSEYERFLDTHPFNGLDVYGPYEITTINL